VLINYCITQDVHKRNIVEPDKLHGYTVHQ